MSLDIAAHERETTHYVGIPVTARLAEFGAPGGPNELIPRIYQWLADHEIAPRGGPLYVYRHIGNTDEPVDLTVAVPIVDAVNGTSGLVAGRLPAGTYVIGRHVGAPDQISGSYARVREWAAANGHRLGPLSDDAGARWTGHAEHFMTDPTEEPDTSKWVTELLFKTA
ncbi:MAG: GyrI-like domain-containing protein [Pseudoclavibacter sp.]